MITHNRILKGCAMLIMLLCGCLASAQQQYSATATLNIRQQPSTDGKVVGKVEKGGVIVVLSIADGWCKTEYNGKEAYVSAKYVTPVKNATRSSERKSKGSVGNIVEWLLSWWWVWFGALVLFFLRGPVFKYTYLIVSFPFMLLNYMQYALSKPWRFLMKDYDNLTSKFARTIVGKGFFLILQVGTYIMLTPLRLVNAVYYNIFVRLLSVFTDLIIECVYPKENVSRRMSTASYIWLLLSGFPMRILKYIVFKGGICIIESLIFVVVDTFYPALTLYHGTSEQASILITQPNTWKVGGGNFAGSGIYFGIAKSTAEHYAQSTTRNSLKSSAPVMIISRVSLGRVMNLNTVPQKIRNMVAKTGDKITEYGLKNNYVTAEWWRTTGEWWEYCLLDSGGPYDYKWRIRPLYVLNLETGMKKRIFGGMSCWLLN